MAILKALFIFKWLMSIKGQGTVSGGRQSRTWREARCEQSWGFSRAPRRGQDRARRVAFWSQPGPSPPAHRCVAAGDKALAPLVTECRILVLSTVCAEQRGGPVGISQQCDSLV